MAQNTISDELNRLIQAKADIKSALEEKGLTIGDSSTLDEFPGLIQEMEVGGGGGGYDVSTVIDLIEGDLTELTIPTGTTKIGNNALNMATLKSVTIPNTVTSIGQSAFENASITELIIPSLVTTIGKSAFRNCAQITSGINLNNNVTKIEESTFENCQNVPSIVGLDAVTSVGYYAFRSCYKVKQIHLLNVSTLANNPFVYCTSLETLVIGDKITSIGQNICQNCNKLQNIVILKNTPPNLGNANSLTGTYKICVPGQSVDTYKNAGGNWNNVSTRIIPLASMNYDPTTYTVTALGRDNVELYVDASLCDSSTYTFDSTTQTGNHTVTVKSVDPSLGVLDTVSQEITI